MALSPERWHRIVISENMEVVRESSAEKYAGRPYL